MSFPCLCFFSFFTLTLYFRNHHFEVSCFMDFSRHNNSPQPFPCCPTVLWQDTLYSSKLTLWSEWENLCIKMYLFRTSTSIYKNYYSVFLHYALGNVYDPFFEESNKKKKKTPVSLCVFEQVQKSMVELQMWSQFHSYHINMRWDSLVWWKTLEWTVYSYRLSACLLCYWKSLYSLDLLVFFPPYVAILPHTTKSFTEPNIHHFRNPYQNRVSPQRKKAKRNNISCSSHESDTAEAGSEIRSLVESILFDAIVV